MKKYVFLDRDGVINRDSADYVKSWREFEFLPRSLGALRKLRQNFFEVVIITNQSAVGRQLISIEDLEHIHAKMKSAVAAAGGWITDIFFCPHLPEDSCLCRKPKPGLIFSAQRKHRMPLAATSMVGDSAKDIECGKLAGCGRTVLVETGNFTAARTELIDRALTPDFIAGDLRDAVDWIISLERRSDSA